MFTGQASIKLGDMHPHLLALSSLLTPLLPSPSCYYRRQLFRCYLHTEAPLGVPSVLIDFAYD